MELWEALSNRRKEIGMSFDELQSKTCLSISTIKKILGGHVSAPSFESVRTIAYAMDITLAELDARIADEESTATNCNDVSSAALALAAAYDSLDDHGKHMLDTVARIEVERIAQPQPKPLPAGIMAIGDMPMYKIPYLGEAVCDGSIETKHAAKQELRELESEALSPDLHQ